jgi:hypothetical protein
VIRVLPDVRTFDDAGSFDEAGPFDDGGALPARRAVLLGALAAGGAVLAGGGLVAEKVLPGRVRLSQLLGLNGPDGVIPDAAPGAVVSGGFGSAFRRGVRTGWTIAYPPGVDPARPSRSGDSRLPVCVVLHGLGGDDRSMIDLGLDRFLADAVRHGTPGFALAAVSGGNGYWHARRNGDDAGRMVVEEFLPLLEGRGLAAGTGDRVAFLGWSMGGFGALLLAERLRAGRAAAVGAMSAALWQRPGDTVRGAFDDPDDFHAHDVFAGRAALAGITVRIDCGRGDPFLAADQAFVAGLHPAAQGGFGPGGHDDGYWRRVAPAQLATIGTALRPGPPPSRW